MPGIIDQAAAARARELAPGARHCLVARARVRRARHVERQCHAILTRRGLECGAVKTRRRRADTDDVQRDLDVGVGAGTIELTRRLEGSAHLRGTDARAELCGPGLDERA